MKTIVTFLMFACCTLGAQETVINCDREISALDSLVNVNNFEQASESFAVIKKNCPPGENFYNAGEKIFKYRLASARAAEQDKAVQDLLSFYDAYDLKLPGNANGNQVKKAMLLRKRKLANDGDVYSLLDKAFTGRKSSFTDADALYSYFEYYYKRFQDPENKLTAGDVLSKADQIENHIAGLNLTADQQTRNVYKNVTQSMAALSAEIITCENLQPYYQSQFENRKQDAVWLQNASNKMLAANCVDDPIFLAVSEAAHVLNPTSTSAYNVGIAAFRTNDQEKAATYFNQSAELNSDPDQKAATYFTLASSVYSFIDKAKAKEFALKAVATQPNYGRAYLFLAQMYGESACGETPFEKKAIYWLAAETALKAGAADAKFKAGAAKMAENYLKKAPTHDEIRKEKRSGKTVTIGCWINETISVPKI